MAESFFSEHQTELSGVTLSKKGSDEAPLSHRDRLLTQGDPYLPAAAVRPIPGASVAAPIRGRDHIVSKRHKTPLVRGAFPVAI
ncbi:hypothetical protein [Brucella intermedia]|uniref:hypothetical protein n=1 Tax=Brucella intermedia TaxID=94625 RepID=UPI000FFC686B|nr:hypothetical protein [Brucella intermedia]